MKKAHSVLGLNVMICIQLFCVPINFVNDLPPLQECWLQLKYV